MENAFEILERRFRILPGKLEQKRKVITGIVLTFIVLHNMLRTHLGVVVRTPTPANDIEAIANVVYVSEENYRNPLGEAEHQREQLKG